MTKTKNWSVKDFSDLKKDFNQIDVLELKKKGKSVAESRAILDVAKQQNLKLEDVLKSLENGKTIAQMKDDFEKRNKAAEEKESQLTPPQIIQNNWQKPIQKLTKEISDKKDKINFVLKKLWIGVILNIIENESFKNNPNNDKSEFSSEAKEYFQKFLEYMFFEKGKTDYLKLANFLQHWNNNINEKTQGFSDIEKHDILNQDPLVIEIRERIGLKESELKTPESEIPNVEKSSKAQILEVAKQNLIEAFIVSNNDKAQRFYDAIPLLIGRTSEEDFYFQPQLSLENKLRNFTYFSNFPTDPQNSSPDQVMNYQKKMAQFGSTEAMKDLGQIYSKCKTAEGRLKGRELYKTAADQGHRQTQCAMGMLYEKAGNLTEAKKYLELSAAQGSSEAQTKLAQIASQNKEQTSQVPQEENKKEVIVLTGEEAAASRAKRQQKIENSLIATLAALPNNFGNAPTVEIHQNSLNIQILLDPKTGNLSKITANGQALQGENIIVESGTAPVLNSETKDEASNLFAHAQAIYEKEEYSESLKIFTKLAEDHNDIDAQYNAALVNEKIGSLLNSEYDEIIEPLLAEGFTKEKSMEEARRLYHLAADQNHSGAQFNLGVSYYQNKDYENAVKFTKLAAYNNEIRAAFNWAYFCHHGDLIPQDFEEARKFYTFAKDHGYDNAMDNLLVLEEAIKAKTKIEKTLLSFKKLTNLNAGNLNSTQDQLKKCDEEITKYKIKVSDEQLQIIKQTEKLIETSRIKLAEEKKKKDELKAAKDLLKLQEKQEKEEALKNAKIAEDTSKNKIELAEKTVTIFVAEKVTQDKIENNLEPTIPVQSLEIVAGKKTEENFPKPILAIENSAVLSLEIVENPQSDLDIPSENEENFEDCQEEKTSKISPPLTPKNLIKNKLTIKPASLANLKLAEQIEKEYEIKLAQENKRLLEVDIKNSFNEGLENYRENNFAEAQILFQFAADKKHPQAQYYMGLMHQRGEINGEPNIGQAIAFYILAANQDVVEAECELAILHLQKDSTFFSTIHHKYQPLVGENLLMLAAYKGNQKAQYHFGILCFEKGNFSDAQYFLKLALESEEKQENKNVNETYIDKAKYYYAASCYENGDLKKAAHFFKKIADTQFTKQKSFTTEEKNYIAQAQYSYAQISYQTGNLREAAKYFELSAQKNYDLAQFNLALMYETGNGVNHDKKKAIALYRSAMSQGLKEAQFNLAELLSHGTKEEFGEAKKLFKSLADQDDVEAQISLGIILREEKGLNPWEKEDAEQEAMKYFNLAARKNHKDAYYYLGEMYEKGEAVEINDNIALKKYEEALQRGQEKAQEKIDIILEKRKAAKPISSLADFEKALESLHQKVFPQIDESRWETIKNLYNNCKKFSQNYPNLRVDIKSKFREIDQELDSLISAPIEIFPNYAQNFAPTFQSNYNPNFAPYYNQANFVQPVTNFQPYYPQPGLENTVMPTEYMPHHFYQPVNSFIRPNSECGSESENVNHLHNPYFKPPTNTVHNEPSLTNQNPSLPQSFALNYTENTARNIPLKANAVIPTNNVHMPKKQGRSQEEKRPLISQFAKPSNNPSPSQHLQQLRPLPNVEYNSHLSSTLNSTSEVLPSDNPPSSKPKLQFLSQIQPKGNVTTQNHG